MSLPLRETCPGPRAVKKEYLSCFLKWKELCWKLQKKHMELHSHCIFFGSSFREKERGGGIYKIIFTSFFFFFSLQNCTRTVGAFKLSGTVVTTKLELHKTVCSDILFLSKVNHPERRTSHYLSLSTAQCLVHSRCVISGWWTQPSPCSQLCPELHPVCPVLLMRATTSEFLTYFPTPAASPGSWNLTAGTNSPNLTHWFSLTTASLSCCRHIATESSPNSDCKKVTPSIHIISKHFILMQKRGHVPSHLKKS